MHGSTPEKLNSGHGIFNIVYFQGFFLKPMNQIDRPLECIFMINADVGWMVQGVDDHVFVFFGFSGLDVLLPGHSLKVKSFTGHE